MKKISIVLISLLGGIAGMLTSCSEDYPGPNPVDVTANYSNKFSNTNSNLLLTYNGEEMIGKSVDFSTVKGETGNITLYDIIPGEEALKLTAITLVGNADSYSFKGNGVGSNTETTFNYEGYVEKGKLEINLTEVKMGNSTQWGHSYRMSDLEYGKRKDPILNKETNLYEWGEAENKLSITALYTDMDIDLQEDEALFLYATVSDVIKGFGGYLVPQLLQTVTLSPDGNIIADYTTDEMQIGEQKFSEIDMDNQDSMDKLMQFISVKLFFPVELGGGFSVADIESVTTGRTYTSSPRGLVYWYSQNGLFYVKLNLPAIIVKAMQDKGKNVDYNLIATLTDALLNSNPAQLQTILVTINKQLDNSLLSIIAGMDKNDFQTIFTWIKNGIPMHLNNANGHTHIYVDKAVLTPFINLLSGMIPTLEAIPTFGELLVTGYVKPIVKAWPVIKTLNIGLDLKVSDIK